MEEVPDPVEKFEELVLAGAYVLDAAGKAGMSGKKPIYFRHLPAHSQMENTKMET